MNWTGKNPKQPRVKEASAGNNAGGTQTDAPQTALFLQGGGALGAYQGGSYAAMAEAGIHPDWVSGISIGAINAAIIAGNPPEQVAKKLDNFWHDIGTGYSDPATTMTHGVPGFFSVAIEAVQNFMMNSMGLMGWSKSTSLYNPKEMYHTLEKFVDFDYLNDKSKTRISVGAVNIENGELVYFDSRKNITTEEGMQSRAKGSIMRNPQEVKKCRIDARHIMASGALIPSFPAVEIEGKHYCDGGLVSNTPVRMAYETGQLNDKTLVIRSDLWSRDGKEPKTVSEAAALAKAIQFSSPPIDLTGKVEGHIHTVLSTRDRQYYNRDFDFSRSAIKENWDAGYKDMKAAIAQYKQAEALPHHGTISAGNGHASSRINVSQNGAGAAR